MPRSYIVREEDKLTPFEFQKTFSFSTYKLGDEIMQTRQDFYKKMKSLNIKGGKL